MHDWDGGGYSGECMRGDSDECMTGTVEVIVMSM